ncbi:FixH family protein [Niveibacterium sp. 24ML]|uniref:FixH family protein n=1 Tax=Niveibacterium sp. 24ML TaxID=2985512 RepID=UPI00226E2948|nr:FixH family protein [Niveibacterium sp. 24ML]MCX9157040.1 FixH family protein [Niveibacterium sp. 24ML]
MMQSPEAPRPWYREPWPWILMGLPGSVVVAGFITLYLAAHNTDGLVVDDYYKEGLSINRTLGRQQAARDAGLQGELVIEGGGARVSLSAKPGVALPAVLSMRIAHPTVAGQDQVIRLERHGNEYRGVMHPLANGRWAFVVEDEPRTWRLSGSTGQTGAAIELTAGD